MKCDKSIIKNASHPNYKLLKIFGEENSENKCDPPGKKNLKEKKKLIVDFRPK